MEFLGIDIGVTKCAVLRGDETGKILAKETTQTPTVTCEKLLPELCKGLQGALPAISLPSQSAILSAYINDVEPEMMYAQLVYGYAAEENLLICLSTSGNSKNIVNAAKVVNALGMKTLSLTGEMGGILSEISDITIKVPEKETYKVQEYHLPVYHYLCLKTEEHFFGAV